jgi:branched-chain amino acid transport system substrate-binding protein
LALTRRKVLTTVVGGPLAISASFSNAAAQTGEEIRIGALCELSGPASTIGSQQALGIQFAVDEINRNGGILGGGPGIGGRPIKLILEDTESKVATGLAKAKKLVERDKVHGLTGIIFSSISLAVQEYVNKEARIPFINSGSSSPAISEPPACGRYSFAGQASARQYAMSASGVAKTRGRRWYFIGDDYPWGRQSVQLMKEAIQLDSKLEIVGEDYAAVGTSNYAPYITKMLAAKPDVIGMVVFGAGYARILKQMQQLDVKAHKHHYFWSQVDAVAAGDAAVGMTAGESYIYDNPQVPRAQGFAKAFRDAHGSWPDPVAARGYTGLELFALAIRDAGSTAPEELVGALEKLDFKQSLLGPLKFRGCDHVAETPIILVEGRKDDTDRIYPAYLGLVENPMALVVPCGKTGCEDLVKKSS